MKVNLCCGMDYRSNYLNVDFSNLGSDGNPIKVDLVHDVRIRLPWPDNEIEEIVFREALEHFNRWDGLNVLKEIYRVLDKGGKLDITVPPAERQIKILLQMINRPVTMEDFFKAHEKFSPWKYHDDLLGATHCTLIDGKDLGQGDSHKTLYSKQWLKIILEHVGFIIESINDEIWIIARK